MEINGKKLKEILKKQHEDSQRYLRVLAESFESQVKLIAESVSGIQEEFAAIKNIIAEITETISNLQIQVMAIKEMVAKNTEDIETIKMDISIIKNNLKEKVDRDEFVALERRLFLLERKMQRS